MGVIIDLPFQLRMDKATVNASKLPDLFKHILNHVLTSPFLTELSEAEKTLTKISIVDIESDESAVGISLESEFRELLKDYPIQKHRSYLSIQYWRDEHLLPPHSDLGIPDEILTQYIESVGLDRFFAPEAYCRAFLEILNDHPDVELLDSVLKGGICGFRFVQKNESEGPHLYIGFVADFLPILLDEAAARPLIKQKGLSYDEF